MGCNEMEIKGSEEGEVKMRCRGDAREGETEDREVGE